MNPCFISRQTLTQGLNVDRKLHVFPCGYKQERLLRVCKK